MIDLSIFEKYKIHLVRKSIVRSHLILGTSELCLNISSTVRPNTSPIVVLAKA